MRAFAKRPSKAELEKIEAVTSEVEQGPKSHPILAPAQDRPTSLNSLRIGQTAEITINLIKPNPLNARRVSSQAGLDELAESMRERGQDVAALAYTDDQGYICLIDGHRRLDACRLADMPTLRVEIRPKPISEQELYLQSRAANTDREAQTPIDDALAWKILLERNVFPSQAELSARLKVDATVMSRTLGLAELPKTLVSMLAERPALLNLRMLDAIKRFYDAAGEDEAESLIIDVMNKDLSSRDVDARRKAIETGPIKRSRGNNQTYKYEKGSSISKLFPEKGKLVLEVKDLKDEKLVEQLNDELNKVVAKFLTK